MVTDDGERRVRCRGGALRMGVFSEAETRLANSLARAEGETGRSSPSAKAELNHPWWRMGVRQRCLSLQRGRSQSKRVPQRWRTYRLTHDKRGSELIEHRVNLYGGPSTLTQCHHEQIRLVGVACGSRSSYVVSRGIDDLPRQLARYRHHR
jgi:hypothetical protein